MIVPHPNANAALKGIEAGTKAPRPNRQQPSHKYPRCCCIHVAVETGNLMDVLFANRSSLWRSLFGAVVLGCRQQGHGRLRRNHGASVLREVMDKPHHSFVAVPVALHLQMRLAQPCSKRALPVNPAVSKRASVGSGCVALVQGRVAKEEQKRLESPQLGRRPLSTGLDITVYTECTVQLGCHVLKVRATAIRAWHLGSGAAQI